MVSFFTRDQGKLRGVARRARRPKSAFGAGLERLSHVRLAYFQRETRELVNLDRCELLHSQFDLASEYPSGVALDFFAEVSEQLLPAAEPNEKFFRLLVSVLDSLRLPEGCAAARAYRAVTYFSLWAVRLAGWLPELHACLGCGSALEGSERAFFARGRAGLVCDHCRRASAMGHSWELSPESRGLAAEILRKPVAQLPSAWPQATASDLRRFLVQQMETQAERRLITASMLEETAAAAN